MQTMNPLNVLYEELDFKGGALFAAMDNPSSCIEPMDWLEKGEWLIAAKRAGAEKIFFVENNPVAVFAKCGTDIAEKVKAFNRIWCLSRPRLLFLASPGEITVYDLAKSPIAEDKQDEWKNLKGWKILDGLRKVAEEFQRFHRENIESGRIFGDERFGDLKNRADKALIRDLKTVRRELIKAGLSGEKVRFAHALIGRSIFIRYLEDREILTKEYFLKVARQRADWIYCLNNPTSREGLDFSKIKTLYPRILMDKDFTYALFRKLADDFNGDMFPEDDEEEGAVTQKHLNLIQGLLYGDLDLQKKLFFYSYNFNIIPLDLISSIYEEFYHPSIDDAEKKKKVRGDGAYYTPPVLVEFVLSRVLTPDVIKKNPRVLDAACGSGIFLVEAFRRIVRYEWYRKKASPTFDELKNILKEQIAGIEVHEEAARITAFSLYLSMLHYLEPPAIYEQIERGNTLPSLVATTNSSINHFHCILPANAFDVGKIESNSIWKERFGPECADIVVGNPPWGAPEKNDDEETKKHHKVMLDWCKANNKPIGDKERSQAFLWRALDFLKKEGKAGMLVSLGVLFKCHDKSESFRKQWFECIKLDTIFNFTHVREFFFAEANWPFVAINFVKTKSNNEHVNYWSAKQSRMIDNVQAVVFSKNDIKIIRNEPLWDYRIWKLYDYAGHKDSEFIKFVDRFPQYMALKKCADIDVGFIKGNKKYNADWLTNYPKIKVQAFSRYDEFQDNDFEPSPSKVYRGRKDRGLYEGNRIVVKETLQTANNSNGRIIARYETRPYACTHSFHVINLKTDDTWRYKILTGILWSSFARYYLFLTSSSWWGASDKILVEEKERLPVVFDKSNPATNKVIAIVDKLRNYHPQKRDVLHPGEVPEEIIDAKRREMEVELDKAVFELYGLNEEQKDLIHDLCEVTLPFLYKPFDSVGAMPAVEKNDISWIENYARIFCRRWNAYLGDDEEMRPEVHLSANGNMVAVEFYPADRDDPWNIKQKDDKWGYILEQIGKSLPQPMGISQIVVDGLVHIVSDEGIIIIKRNEKRFWTRSLAREDADATLCKRMVDTMPKEERSNF